ncbi:MAG TPA: pyridoxal 5'-phosphate synthase [Solirubrobacteraceae bacterium]|nr:pyridoxal 5'-phosphate synthase [Solirubrobacteraceae bacterium]
MPADPPSGAPAGQTATAPAAAAHQPPLGPEPEPLRLLRRWLADAAAAGVPEPGAVAFVTVGADGRPSARTVLLKRVEPDALVFTSALWTRKAREIAANPNVALLFYWPAVGRQVQVAGRAVVAERALAVALFAQRERSHQVQALVSRQGEPIPDLAPLRARHVHLMDAMERSPDCPEDWGAIRIAPEAFEFWSESTDRMHDRLLYTRDGNPWRVTRLAP